MSKKYLRGGGSCASKQDNLPWLLLNSLVTEVEVYRRQILLKPHMRGFLLAQDKVLRRFFFSVLSFYSVWSFCQIRGFVLKLSNKRCNEP